MCDFCDIIHTTLNYYEGGDNFIFVGDTNAVCGICRERRGAVILSNIGHPDGESVCIRSIRRSGLYKVRWAIRL